MSEVTVVLRMSEADADVLRHPATADVRVVAVDHDGNEGSDMPATVYRVGSLPDPEPEPKPHRCPRCDSPAPSRHPAVQSEGEVSVCPDPWHDDPITASIRERISS